MSPTPLTTGADSDAVPTVEEPEPDTDRGVSDRTQRFLNGVVSFVAVVAVSGLLGDPVTWSDVAPTIAGLVIALAVVSAVCSG